MKYYIQYRDGSVFLCGKEHFDMLQTQMPFLWDTVSMVDDEVYLSSSSHKEEYHMSTYGEHVDESNLIL
jgi:hypothetical protein